MHTLTSNVHGPDRPVALAGVPVRSIIPISAGEAGNITVGFIALSYAGTFTITVVADPDGTPDLPVLVTALSDQLDALTRPTPPGARGVAGHLVEWPARPEVIAEVRPDRPGAPLHPTEHPAGPQEQEGTR